MSILLSLSTENIIAVVAAAIAIIGILLTCFQLYQTKKVDEARLVGDMLKVIRSNERLSEIEHYLDYNVPWYGDDFHDSELETSIDDFLALMNYICFLERKRLIGKRAAKIFEYELIRTIKNPDCLCYLWNLYHWCISKNKKCPFAYLIEYAMVEMSEEKRKAFESNNEAVSGYRRYLNF